MPAFDIARAMPRPMPSEPAVMYAVFPARSFNGAGWETVGSGGGAGRGGGAEPVGGVCCASTVRLAPASAVATPALAARVPRNLRRSTASPPLERDDEDDCLLAIRALVGFWRE